MSKRLIGAYAYLAVCMLCAVVLILLIATDAIRYAAWLLVVAVPLWVGGILWSIRVRR